MDQRECGICATLAPAELIELDLVLGDPLRWPVTVWKGFRPPVGGLPASYRRFGAMNMGTEWLKANGFDFSRKVLRGHYNKHVPVLSASVDELIARGLIALAPANKADTQLGQPIDPLNYIKFYNKGIEVGLLGLDLLAKRVQALIDRDEDVPLPLVKLIVDAGLKLASSQAAIKAAGKTFGDEGGDENDAFRGGGDISQPFAHVRVRKIEGVSRPVADEGLADRTAYNERAAQEGSPRIGGR